MAAGDDSSFKAIEEQEAQKPSSPRMDGNHPVYHSRAAVTKVSGHAILTDFGQIVPAAPEFKNVGWCMPDLSRAPEVLFGLPWSCPVDVWSVGIMVRI